jgi:hypothetical protein
VSEKCVEELYRNFILDKNIISEPELDALVSAAKREPENLRIAAATFAGSRKALAEFGLSDMIERLASKPPSKSKEN